MEEELPFISLDLAGAEFQATPLNATFFSFAGRSVLENGDVIDNESRNHVFLETGRAENEVVIGTYIFQKDIVQQMAAAMIRHGFPCHLNIRAIPKCDEESYQKYINQQMEEVPDTFPEDWK